MLTATEFVNEFRTSNPDKRFDMMFNNFYQLDDIMDIYRENLIFKIFGEVEYQLSHDRNQEDVRVQRTMGFSDAVFSEINLRQNVESLMDADIYEYRFNFYLYDNQELIEEVKNFFLTKREIGIFCAHIDKLRGEARYIITEFISRDKDYQEIGNVMNIDADSVRRRIFRLKKKLRNGIIGAISR